MPYLGYSDIYILKAEYAKAGCIVGSVASGYAGYERGGLCARFASTIMWHRIAMLGGPLWPPCFKK